MTILYLISSGGLHLILLFYLIWHQIHNIQPQQSLVILSLLVLGYLNLNILGAL